MLHYNGNSNRTYFLLCSVKFIEYIFSAESVSSNPCVGPLPKMEIYFFLLSIFVDELISAPEIVIFLPVSLLGCEKNPSLSNAISYPEYFSDQYQHF